MNKILLHIFFTIVDDFTHLAKLYPIVQKSETAGIMQDYIERAENCFSYRHLKVVSVRTDNGSEFCNSELKNFYFFGRLWSFS